MPNSCTIIIIYVFSENFGSTMIEKLSICQIHLKPLKNPYSGELSNKIYRKCCFCGKNCQNSGNQFHLANKLSGNENFYCLFCLRHSFNKENKDILILSFKSVITYFYLQKYISPKSDKLWISEIEDYIDSHKKTGLLNPLFLYDEESMFWFIDFSKVGDGEKQLPLTEILKTIINILACFNLFKTAENISMSNFYEKFRIAVDSFFNQRYIPENSRTFIPTLVDVGAESKIRNFVFSDLKINF